MLPSYEFGVFEEFHGLRIFITNRYMVFKAAVLKMLKNGKKITVNTGQVMFSVEIYYY